jgi:hypothetical protein
MGLLWKFPDYPPEEAARRCAEFQRLSSDERFREVISVIALGWRILQSSPYRAAIEEQWEEDEKRWREIQQQLFANYKRSKSDNPVN